MEAIATLKEPGGCNKTTIGAYIEVFCFHYCIFFLFSLTICIVKLLLAAKSHRVTFQFE